MDGLIHMGWAAGLAGFAQVNLSPDGDGCRQAYIGLIYSLRLFRLLPGQVFL
jgi:hypothetical protein